MVIGKPPRGRKPWMLDSSWALIEMRNNLKKDIEATRRKVKRSIRHDKRSHVEKLAESAEEAAFVGDLGEV